MTFDVPRQLMPQLAAFFEELEANKEEMGILDLHLSLPSLEEVFLRIADESEKDAKRKYRAEVGDDAASDSDESQDDQLWEGTDDDDDDDDDDEGRKHEGRSFPLRRLPW